MQSTAEFAALPVFLPWTENGNNARKRVGDKNYCDSVIRAELFIISDLSPPRFETRQPGRIPPVRSKYLIWHWGRRLPHRARVSDAIDKRRERRPSHTVIWVGVDQKVEARFNKKM